MTNNNTHIADRLCKAIEETKSIACVGLDPRPNLIPPELAKKAIEKHGDTKKSVAYAFSKFNKKILKAIAGHCPIVKPQVACYEAYGHYGIKALEKTIKYANELGIMIVIDGKRNDIGSTATHYEQAWTGSAPSLTNTLLPSNSVGWQTINGWLGIDGVNPFLDKENSKHGVFALVKTSNPSSADLQGVKLDSESNEKLVMHKMASLVNEWGKDRIGESGFSDIGAVVGATYPEEAAFLRTLMPNTIFLVPGYGSQGGTAKDALAGLRDDKKGIIVNASRSINGAWKQEKDMNFDDAARLALDDMNEDLNKYL